MVVQAEQEETGSVSEQPPGRGKRSWRAAIAISVPVLAGAIVVSATLNPLIGRAVHWDWMAVAAPVLFVVMVIALRKRWA